MESSGVLPGAVLVVDRERSWRGGLTLGTEERGGPVRSVVGPVRAVRLSCEQRSGGRIWRDRLVPREDVEMPDGRWHAGCRDRVEGPDLGKLAVDVPAGGV